MSRVVTTPAARVTETGSSLSPAYRWIKGKRPLLTALFVIAALVLALWDPAHPTSLVDSSGSIWFLLSWAAMLIGVAVRIWGAGNLRKNQEITDTGIYRMVRHPLYLGSLLIFFAYFVTVGSHLWGVVLFLAMVLLVYYPTMFHEEEGLARHFPEHVPQYAQRPRLLPNLLRLPEALETDRFSLRVAYHNLGVRSLWVLVFLPLFLELLTAIEQAI
jgi:protein-S-isoprenylcysteine O-methyltransferase Ste14